MALDLTTDKAYWLGDHEPEVALLLERVSCAGGVSYDIGAHMGYFALALARFAGPAGRVFAFEPDVDNCALIGKNARLNGLNNIEVVPFGVLDKNGPIEFCTTASSSTGRTKGEAAAPAWLDEGEQQLGLEGFVAAEQAIAALELGMAEERGVDVGEASASLASARSLGANQLWRDAFLELQRTRALLRTGLTTENEVVVIQTVSIDAFVNDQGHPAPDLMVIDVEGAEGKVLQGAVNVLARVRPVVVCEVHNIDAGREVLRTLRDHDYRAFDIRAGFTELVTTVFPIPLGGVHLVAFHEKAVPVDIGAW